MYNYNRCSILIIMLRLVGTISKKYIIIISIVIIIVSKILLLLVVELSLLLEI